VTDPKAQPETSSSVADADEPMLSVAEARELIGKRKISRGAFYNALKRGDVPHLRLGNRILISREWVRNQLNGLHGK
jgi:hypothetical protein